MVQEEGLVGRRYQMVHSRVIFLSSDFKSQDALAKGRDEVGGVGGGRYTGDCNRRGVMRGDRQGS